MQTVDSFVHVTAAQLAQAYLEGHGIEASIPNEHSVEAIPVSSQGGIRLQVADKDADMARELIRIYHSDQGSGPSD